MHSANRKVWSQYSDSWNWVELIPNGFGTPK